MPPLPRYLTLYFALMVCLGAGMRLTRLEAKPYWFNEVFTALRISGYDEHDDANPRLYTGQVVTAADIRGFQRPNAERNIIDTMRGLARKEPQLPPLYFVLARWVTSALGDTVLATRGLAALGSLLGLAALGWLARELFRATSVTWVAVGLAAVSPLFVRYAQEARPYGLWIAFVLLASAALLRALRQPARLAWAIYAAFLALALYTHTLTVYVMAAHGLYVLAMQWSSLIEVLNKYRTIGRGGVSPSADAATAPLLGYTLASALAVVAFAPWIWLFLRHLRTAILVGGYLTLSAPFNQMLETSALNLSRLFVAWPPAYNGTLVYLALPIGLMCLYALYTVIRQAPSRVWRFIVLLVIVPALPHVVPDVMLGGQRSLAARYLFPTFIGLQLAVAYLLARQMTQASALRARLWRLLSVGLVVVGLAASWTSIQAATWWGLSEVDLELAHLFAAAPQTVVITDVPFGTLAPLSYYLPADTRFVLTKQPDSLIIPADGAPTYLYQPSDALRATVEGRLGRQLSLIYQKPREERTLYSVYRIEKP